MKNIFSLQLGLTLFFTVVAFVLAGPLPAKSFLLGATIAAVNLGTFAIITQRIFNKKSVATTLLIIIFKYTILALGLYIVVTQNLVDLVWFVVGLSTLVPSALGYVFISSRQTQCIKVEKETKKEY